MATFARSLVAVMICVTISLVLTASLNPVARADDVSNEGSPYVEQADLAAVIKTRNVDAILDALNKVKQMHYQGQMLPFVLDLWNLQKEKYPDIPWDVVSFDIVRLD